VETAEFWLGLWRVNVIMHGPTVAELWDVTVPDAESNPVS
jgi:hypothetical protein